MIDLINLIMAFIMCVNTVALVPIFKFVFSVNERLTIIETENKIKKVQQCNH